MFLTRVLIISLPLLGAALYTLPVKAAGIVPETSLLIIEEADMGGTLNLTNTDSHPNLLYTTITDLPDDQGTHLMVTQPVVRVEAGQTQQLRFILRSDKPLTTEHLKRVIFEGIPPKDPSKKMKIGFNLRQDIPVLIHPKGLPVVKDAWKLLQWSATGTTMTVKNPSPYVVRLAQNVKTLPSGANGILAKTYILPGETMTTKLNKTAESDGQLQFIPASRYGIDVPSFTAPLNQ
ncbi:fimbria/pilus chaperone family protein [Scandinavium sp. V105_16]|uniref:Fimbria/pilus chaperone family protein n=1 Tax=Scandinavium lactucae TaxID=3095028 RepID=A0AAJ2S3N6_9ENTR|nr:MULTISPECIES: fimbria/pilus chaperone family protein [unclassified Scandinavium]MDX6022287.1 fimbria/pilus chaperone family protein [Scandinavium sp. V105_16]MDX6033871.1 fimbria/pilus chaperone family protein [Scandinavium sp. V105_12]